MKVPLSACLRMGWLGRRACRAAAWAFRPSFPMAHTYSPRKTDFLRLQSLNVQHVVELQHFLSEQGSNQHSARFGTYQKQTSRHHLETRASWRTGAATCHGDRAHCLFCHRHRPGVADVPGHGSNSSMHWRLQHGHARRASTCSDGSNPTKDRCRESRYARCD